MRKLKYYIKLVTETYREVKAKQARRLNFDEKMIKADNIIVRACNCAEISVEDFWKYAPTRKRKYLYPRQISMSLMHISLGLTQVYIEDFFKKKHPAVTHSMKCVNNMLDTDKEFKNTYKSVFDYACELNPATSNFFNCK